MSSSSTQRVGRAPKDRGNKGQYSPQSTKPPPDGSKTQDGVNPKNQPTAEQMRIAQITYDMNKSDDPDLQRKIEQVMELTGKTADTVIIALHDCDNETERAVDMLLEGDQDESEWETSGKKKKNRQPASQKQTDNNVTSGNPPNNKDKENKDRSERSKDNKREGGFRNRGPPRLNRGSGRNWRNKENEKNEKNLEENRRDRNVEGRFRGGARRGARGRGGRVRMFQNRVLSNMSTSSFPQSIDTWTNSTVEQTDSGGHIEGNMSVGNWSEFSVTEDWSEEDWNESLTETKVFTPSASNQATIEVNENTRAHLPQSIDLATLLQKPDPPTTQSSLQANGIIQSHHSSSVVSQPSSQSQFSLSQYAQQAAETIKAELGITSSLNSSSAPTYSASVFQSSDSDQSSVQLTGDLQPSVNNHTTAQQIPTPSLTKTSSVLPQRNKMLKPRIPPPSKIPESAVEMPDDAIMALDVQFGALEFGADSSPFDFTNLSDSTSSYQDSSLNSATNHMNSQPVTGSHTGASNSSASMSNSLSSSLSKETSFVLGSSSSSTNHSSIAKDIPPPSASMGAQPPKVVSGPESILLSQQQDRKNITGTGYTNQRTSSTTAIDGSYSSQKASILGAASTNYIHQNSSLESQSLLGSNNSQNSYMSSSQSHSLSASSAPYSMQQSAYVPPSPSVTYPSQTAYTQQNTAYSYTAQQGYSGSNSSTNHVASIASSKLSSSIGHAVDSQAVSQHSYEPNSATGMTSTLATTTGSTSVGLSAANMTGSSTLGLASTSSSTTTTSVLKNSLSASKTLPTMPPGVPAAMMSHQYIMGQAGLPFYGLQQPLYSSYEEMQMLPSRLQPLGYYDMQFPAATSLTGRDPNLGSVAYTGDIKYSRADSDVSSVATTLSQGQAATQAHGQTFLNPAALPHGYGYYFHSGVMPGGLHPYGTPIFPVPAATNTHGASSSTQYQKTSFGSHSYCSGTGTATDLSNSIYSKAHTQLAKSFEKPGFHAGTPPPFNMAATQPTGPIGASSTPYGATPFIPVIAHSQHHSTMLHHHLQQDSSQQGTPSGGPQRSAQQSMGQQKGAASSKQNFPYWNNN